MGRARGSARKTSLSGQRFVMGRRRGAAGIVASFTGEQAPLRLSTVTRCPTCGQENPGGFKFCGACGAELAAFEPSAREVRKTVTVLFCDVTGSTSLGEQ